MFFFPTSLCVGFLFFLLCTPVYRPSRPARSVTHTHTTLWHLVALAVLLCGRRGTCGTGLAPVARLVASDPVVVFMADVAFGAINSFTHNSVTHNSFTHTHPCHTYKSFAHNFLPYHSFTYNSVTPSSFTQSVFHHLLDLSCLRHMFCASWKKLTCGVIRSFIFFHCTILEFPESGVHTLFRQTQLWLRSRACAGVETRDVVFSHRDRFFWDHCHCVIWVWVSQICAILTLTWLLGTIWWLGRLQLPAFWTLVEVSLSSTTSVHQPPVLPCRFLAWSSPEAWGCPEAYLLCVRPWSGKYTGRHPPKLHEPEKRSMGIR